ncbi:hypothetical protein [Herbaspirillum sp.]|uniref:hypothetical protein n=1 Tax=Herbaspirillum sp. TaxID=1890675 RepID=UPI001B1BC557|nr:hypothetical protein [Herbaspirillum sp.]MBO9538071.1 hypothetical protein [Herbaspirillum sp.]
MLISFIESRRRKALCAALATALSGLAADAGASLVAAAQEECRKIAAATEVYCQGQKDHAQESCAQQAQAVQERCYQKITEHDAAYEREKKRRMQEEDRAARERMLKDRSRTGAAQ